MPSNDLSTLGADWLPGRIGELPDEVRTLSAPEWAEETRYLPPPNRFPGPYRFKVAPYMREILDCMSTGSPIREVAVMKGVQLGLTVGVLENAIGYWMDHVGSAAMMMVTADSELAKLRMESNVTPMIQSSGLEHLIQSSDETNRRKTGHTNAKIEWKGGGFLVPLGARNANKMRSIPIQVLLRDEVDGWPNLVGNDGDPMQLTEDRTSSYEETRKVLDISTPLIKGQSKIHSRYQRGDQRQYHVRCKSCGYSQILHWRHVNKDTGERTGILWETEGGVLVPESVRYACVNCGHEHVNEDKVQLLDPAHGAEWVPTAKPVNDSVRSYHISGLYSPVGFRSWAKIVQMWLDAWDEDAGRPKDIGNLQVFYNNALGQVWEVYGEKLKFQTVSAHRRKDYNAGEIPNQFALDYCGSEILILTLTADVQGDDIAAGLIGWTRDQRAILVDYWRWKGDPAQEDDPDTWGQLADKIETAEWVADDGKVYRPSITLVDSGFMADQVYGFCAQYEMGVYPIKGRDIPPKSASLKEFSPFTTTLGTKAFSVTVDLYKDRWAARLRRQWDGQSEQPHGHFNAPGDLSDAALQELTKETKKEKKDATGKVVGYQWHKHDGQKNELWDVLMYGTAALEMVAWDVCTNRLGLEFVNWASFWEVAQTERLFYSERE